MKNPYLDVSRAIAEARYRLSKEDGKGALEVLRKLEKEDFRGVHQGYPEYYQTLIAVLTSLGMDTRNAESRLAGLTLDWVGALKRGRAELRKGNAEEALALFQRSLASNPGEAGTSSGMDDAWRGMAEAYRRLGREEEARRCMDQVSP